MAYLLRLGFLIGLLHARGSSEEDSAGTCKIVESKSWLGDLVVSKQQYEVAASTTGEEDENVQNDVDVDVDNLNRLGTVLHLLGCFGKSFTAFNQSLALYPDQPAIQKKLGFVMSEMASVEERAGDFVATNVGNAAAARFMGSIWWSQDQNDKRASLGWNAAGNIQPAFKVEDPSSTIPAFCDKEQGQCCSENDTTTPLVVPPVVSKVLAFTNDMDTLRTMSGPLRAGHMVHLENALDSELAEGVYKALEEARANFTTESWNVLPGVESLMAGKPEESSCKTLADGSNGKSSGRRQHLKDWLHPDVLQHLMKFLTDVATLGFITELSGVPIVGVDASALHFQAGDFVVSPDADISERSLGFVLQLSKSDPDNCVGGGAEFVWCNPFTVLPASFNTLTLFKVTPESSHYMNMVGSGSCQRTDFVISGWFLRASPHKLRTKPQGEGSHDKIGKKSWNALWGARLFLEKATRLDPGDAESFQELGAVKRLLHVPQGAFDAHKAAAALEPDSAIAHSRLGQSALALNDTKEAGSAFAKAVKLAPDNPRRLAEVGDLSLQLGEYKKAKKVLVQASTMLPSEASLWNGLGDAHKELGDEEAAIEAFRKTIELQPNHFDALLSLGTTLGKRQEWSKALDSLEKAEKLQPNNALANYNLGLTYNFFEETKKAKKVFQKALKIDPQMSEAELELGRTLMNYGDLEESKKKILHYLKSPTAADAANGHYTLGLVSEKMRDHEGAKIAFEKALELGLKNPQADYRLGVVSRRLGDYEAAKEALERAVGQTGAADHTRELAEVLEQLGETEEAEALHKKLLNMDTEKKPEKIW